MRILLTLSLIFFLNDSVSFSQDLRKRLGRTYFNADSVDIIFELEKENLHAANDSGIYYFFVAEKYNREFENALSQEMFLKSASLLDPKQSNDLISLCYIRLNRLEANSGNWDRALFYSQKGLENATTGLDSNYMGYALLDISVVYHDMEDYARGVEYGKKAHELLAHFNKANPTFIAYSLNAIAINFDDWDKPDSALFYHYKIFDNIDKLDSSRISFTFNNIGNTLLKQEKYKEAQSWIQTAVKLNMKDKDDYSLAANYTNLATIAYKLSDFPKAEILMDSAYRYVEQSKSTEKMRDYLEEQYRFHKAKGELSTAMDYLEQYSTLKDSIFKEERVKVLGELEAKYQVETKERELAESRAALVEHELLAKNRNNQILLLVVFLLIILGVGFFIYYRQKTKNRHLEQEAKLQQIYAEQETQKRLHEQRNRISSDLHDNIGAQLTFIVSSLDNLKFLELSKEKMVSKIDQISAFTVETVNELRDTIWAMNKDNISLSDLQIRLAGLIAKAKVACPQIDYELEMEDDLERDLLLNSMEGVNYYRVAQEALNNAIKHSEANRIKIVFSQKNGQIRVCIEDNGKGLVQEGIGNGLGNMRNRAERIGRELKIDSATGKGTQVCIF
ncbi:tetratricopeptide repeat protein [Algoriphagus sp. D3-2-R+10]|uniref:tetratricopeptide repeat-containing sensor histidine kinase n=1 Tax=Algoriphagus aurantiacus TaxID=3103948 RepID=UPI002B38E908|nr:tetratricopeptide repeat protein [Algoriphagus sp. D3-2-R+10]MEB2774001.1 tetratricopeptide repeat protein [Algoriphagus sp. D3-2-R+10]